MTLFPTEARRLRVLVACEYSGTVRDAFRALGHDAVSCDLLPSARPGPHVAGDVCALLNEHWDMMIAHPPCTYMSVSGAKHLYIGGKRENGPDPARWEKMREGAEFFRLLWTADVPLIAVENPVIFKAARDIIGADPAQRIQPWQFGHEASKTTCLWLKGLPLLEPTNIVGRGEFHVTKSGKRLPKWYNLPPSEDRGHIRSATFQGIANAMAEQWGGAVITGGPGV